MKNPSLLTSRAFRINRRSFAPSFQPSASLSRLVRVRASDSVQDDSSNVSFEPFLVFGGRDPLSPLHLPVFMADGSGRWHGGARMLTVAEGEKSKVKGKKDMDTLGCRCGVRRLDENNNNKHRGPKAWLE